MIRNVFNIMVGLLVVLISGCGSKDGGLAIPAGGNTDTVTGYKMKYFIDGGVYDNRVNKFILQGYIRQYQITFYSNNDPCPDFVSLTGPQGSPFTPSITINQIENKSKCSYQVTSDNYPTCRMKPTLLPGGEYKLADPARILSFNIAEQPKSFSNIIIYPTVVLGNNNTVEKLQWSYLLPKNSVPTKNREGFIKEIWRYLSGKNSVHLISPDGVIRNMTDPGDLVTNIGRYISGQNSFLAINPEGLIKNISISWKMVDGATGTTSVFISPLVTEFALSEKNIIWNQVEAINASYEDYYGNSYNIKWLTMARKPKEIMMIGHSLTLCGNWDIRLNTPITVFAIGGSSIGLLNSNLSWMLASKPHKLYVMIGSSDIEKGLSEVEIIKKFNNLITIVHNNSPNTKLFIQSILPRSDKAKTAKTSAINEQLRNLCERRNVTFINLFPYMMKGDVINPEYTIDGHHISEAGYTVLKKILAQYIP